MNVLEVRLVKETDNIDGDTLCLVVLDVPDDLVGVGLSPVACGAAGVGHSAEVTAIEVGACAGISVMVSRPVRKIRRRTGSLHVPISTPCIGVDGVHTPGDGLVGKPDLVLVVPGKRDVVELSFDRKHCHHSSRSRKSGLPGCCLSEEPWGQ